MIKIVTGTFSFTDLVLPSILTFICCDVSEINNATKDQTKSIKHVFAICPLAMKTRWFSGSVWYQTAGNAHHLKQVDSWKGFPMFSIFIKHVIRELILFILFLKNSPSNVRCFEM